MERTTTSQKLISIELGRLARASLILDHAYVDLERGDLGLVRNDIEEAANAIDEILAEAEARDEAR
jgi:hypothetical protein